MKSVNILLKEAQNIKSLVSIINKYPYDIDLRSGRYVVDAKSILGIFSLDLSKPVTMEIYNDDCDALLNDIKDFIVK
ncbi:MAG TPA: HPr family phosphocarrier protein [Firmicutes bacterium]|nr:HPr family phosphocarrier protein [Bacillota bacterium]